MSLSVSPTEGFSSPKYFLCVTGKQRDFGTVVLTLESFADCLHVIGEKCELFGLLKKKMYFEPYKNIQFSIT